MPRRRRHRDQKDGYPPRDEWLLAAPRGRDDPWAHRRGEPRGFALLWSCYLLGACVISLFTPAARWSFDVQQIRWSCALLVTLMLLGVSVVWPLLRLSQIPARGPSRAAAVDLLLVLAPMVAIVAPMAFLTRWAGAVALALGTVVASWTLLYGGVIAACARTRSGAFRALSMLLCLALAGAAPLAVALFGSNDADALRAGLLASPLTAPFAIARFPDPHSPFPDALVWRLALMPLAPAAAAWALGAALDLARPPHGRRTTPDAATRYS